MLPRATLPTGPKRSPPPSHTYISETETMASPAGLSTPAALPIDEEAEHARQSFTACYNNYCLIHKSTNDSAWYP
jgi:hypothetical protein